MTLIDETRQIHDYFFSKTKAKVALIFIRRFNFVDDFILSSIFFFIHFTLLATYLKMNMLTYAQTHTVHFFHQVSCDCVLSLQILFDSITNFLQQRIEKWFVVISIMIFTTHSWWDIYWIYLILFDIIHLKYDFILYRVYV